MPSRVIPSDIMQGESTREESWVPGAELSVVVLWVMNEVESGLSGVSSGASTDCEE